MPPEDTCPSLRAVFHHQGNRQGLGPGLGPGLRIRTSLREAPSVLRALRAKARPCRSLLPRTQKTPAQCQRHPAKISFDRPIPGSSRGQVLLVEDDDEVAALTSEMIQHLGYQPLRVTTAAAALGALANGRAVDIVFSDVMMPGTMNGLDLAREIQRRHPRLPVLLTSGHLDVTNQVTGAANVRLLAKPYRLEELGQAFETVRHEFVAAHEATTPANRGSSL